MAKVRNITLIVMTIVAIVIGGQAEKEPSEVWVLCQPDSFVYVRQFPKKDSAEIGRLELGDIAWTDGKKKNGFLHIWVMGFECDGYIKAGYVSRTPVQTCNIQAKIVSRGRVRARTCVKGKRRKWVKKDSLLWVYGYGEEWAVTSEGFVQMKFIEMEGI